VSITDTLAPSSLTTYTLVPSGVTATPRGPFPTEIGEPTTVLVAVSITDTVSSVLFVM
jgi:hypothetical protein